MAAAVFRNTLFASRVTMPARAISSTISRRCFSQSTPFLAKRFTESHEWVDLDPATKKAKIGITKYAAEALGDIVYVELPSQGDELAAGDAFGSVESVKSASDLVTPVAGTVSAVHEKYAEEPKDLGDDPEGDAGWLIEIEAAGEEAEGLMDAEAYAEFIKEH